MAILIRDMDMPYTCSDCRFAVNGWCYAIPADECQEQSTEYTGLNGRLYDCPLEDTSTFSFRISKDLFNDLIDKEFFIGGVKEE